MAESENPFRAPGSDSATTSKSRSWGRTIAGTIGGIFILYGSIGVVITALVFAPYALQMAQANPIQLIRWFAIPIISLLIGVLFLRRALRPSH